MYVQKQEEDEYGYAALSLPWQHEFPKPTLRASVHEGLTDDEGRIELQNLHTSIVNKLAGAIKGCAGLKDTALFGEAIKNSFYIVKAE